MRVAIVYVGDPTSAHESAAGLPYAFGPRRVYAALLDSGLPIEVAFIESAVPDPELIGAELERFDPDVIGGAAYVWSFPTLVEVARRAKQLQPDRLVVLGGPSARPQMFELAPFRDSARVVDALVLGEGELAFGEIVAARLNGTALGDVPGLALPEAGRFVRTRERTPSELDALPSPHRAGIMPRGATTCLETHRGCPLHCAFCEWGAEKHRIQAHSEAVLASELARIRELEAPEVFVVDAALNLNRQAFARFSSAERTVRLFAKAEMSCELYATHLRDEDLELLSECRTRRVGVGLQSFNPDVLRAMQRPFDAVRFVEGVRRLAEVAPATLEIILGLPGDDPKSFEDTLMRALELPAASVHVFHCLVLPDGLMTRAPEGSAIDFDPLTLAMRSCRGWSARDLAAAGERLSELCSSSGGRHDGMNWEIPTGASSLRRGSPP